MIPHIKKHTKVNTLMANRDKRNRDFGSNRERFRDFSDEKPRKKDKHWKKANKERRKEIGRAHV